MKPILLVADTAHRIAEVLQPRFPEHQFVQVPHGGAVSPALHEHQPEIAFSIKHSEFPGELHRPLVDFPSMRWVHVGGSGYEHLVPWDGERMTLTNSVGVLAPFLAETVIGAMLAMNGRLPLYLQQQRERVWQPHQFKPVCDQTLLVVGLGAIGEEVAQRAKALGMRVIAVRRTAQPQAGIDAVYGLSDLTKAASEADVISVHIRASEETRHLFDARAFAAMKPGALFMNTSRGLVVDEPSLVNALQSGHLGGAYLDVFAVEPLPQESLLWTLPNVLITPHTSDQVIDYPERFAKLFGDNLQRWIAGQTLINELSL